MNEMLQHNHMVDRLLLVRYRWIFGNDDKLRHVSSARWCIRLRTYL